ncbi:MAG TPA: hypothetical protein VG714_01345 [Acidobacteriaceae bacterium]|nr:hypothetical protein [Acidobacteriaceae bacterium]
MTAPQTTSSPQPDPDAIAGSKDSLGQQSRRDGRPATSDNVVEAIDEEGPQIPHPDPQASDQ